MRIVLAALVLAWPAAAVEILDTLPGVDATAVAWHAGTPLLAGGQSTQSIGELRWLGVHSTGGLLLAQRQELDAAVVDLAAGSRLSARLHADGSLRFQERGAESVAGALPGIRVLAREGDLLLAADASLLWMARLDASDPQPTPVIGNLPAPPTALCVTAGAWWTDADSLRGVGIGDPPLPLGRAGLPGVSRLAGGGGRLAACLGEAGLRVVDVDDVFSPQAGPVWNPGGPVLDAAWWRDGLFVLALGDSGLAVADLSNEAAPVLRGRWRTTESARRLALRGDSLLAGEGEHGLSLHVLRLEAGSPRLDLLARHATRPHLVSVPWVGEHEQAFWCLDRRQGFRRFRWDWEWNVVSDPLETAAIPLPLPVDGGDITTYAWDQPLLFAGNRYGAGLRYYQESEAGIHLLGIHPTDPVQLLAWGPDDLIAYVTPTAFVAIKQANRSPWYLFHHGTINLQAQPLSAVWSNRSLFVGCADGRLFHVNVTDPLHPTLEQTFQLGGPVWDLAQMNWGDAVVAAAGDLYMLHTDYNGGFELMEPLAMEGEVVRCGFGSYGLAATRDPHMLFEYYTNGSELLWFGEVEVPAAPLAVERDGFSTGYAGLENGDLCLLDVVICIDVEPGPARPGGLSLAAAPNPFNPATRLSFTLWTPLPDARLTVHDVAGRQVHARELGALPAGPQVVDVRAEGWPSGLYLASLEAGERRETIKLLLVR
jgi:hypothetical protein